MICSGEMRTEATQAAVGLPGWGMDGNNLGKSASANSFLCAVEPIEHASDRSSRAWRPGRGHPAAEDYSGSGSLSGFKAIKAILAGTLAMNENWILTKALISSICRL